MRRPGRAVLTSLGTALGAGAIVAVAGLGQTVSHQVSSRFDARRATEVVVVDAEPTTDGPAFDAEGLDRLQALNGVVAAGELWQVDQEAPVSSTLLGEARPMPVYAVAPGAMSALNLRVSSGRIYDRFSERRAEDVVVLGRVAADRLGVSDPGRQPAVFLDGRPFVVVGIAAEVERRPQLLTAVMIPTATALQSFSGSEEPHEVQIEAAPGAAQVIATQAPMALRPQGPDRLRAQAPPDSKEFRRSIERDIDRMVYLLGAVCLLAGMLAIASSSLTAVIERIGEIGLRRATGARPRHIGAQFIIEATMTGLLGGLVGAAVGCAAISVVSLGQHWTPVLDPRLPLLAPAAGVATGALAGLLPGLRASRITPVEALRR